MKHFLIHATKLVLVGISGRMTEMLVVAMIVMAMVMSIGAKGVRTIDASLVLKLIKTKKL